MAMVNERLEEAAKNGTSDNISERLAALSYRIHIILSELKDKMPPGGKKDITTTDNETREEATSASDEARETIDRAKIATINSQIKALRILAENKPERALDISSDTIEKLMERARFRVSENVTTDNITGDVEETLDYADRIAALEEEIAAIAEEKGIDVTAIQERLAHSTANRLETLIGVYEKAPEAARNGIENAIENSVRKYERTVEKLREKNVSDEITENTTALQKIPAKIKEKLNIKISNKAQITEDISDNVTIQVRIEKENQERTKEQPAASANKTSSPQKGG
jgi:flavin-binding protein dodecin